MKRILTIIFIITLQLPVFCQETTENHFIEIKSSVIQPFLQYTNQFDDDYDLELKQSYSLSVSTRWVELVSTDHNNKIVYWLRAKEHYEIGKKGNNINIISKNRQAEIEANFFAELERICPTGNRNFTDEIREHKKAKKPAYRDSVRSARLYKGLNLLESYRKTQQVSDEFYALCKSYLNVRYYTYPSPNSKLLSHDDKKNLQRIQNDELLFAKLYRSYLTLVACKDSLQGHSREYANFSLVKRSFDNKEKAFTEVAIQYLKESYSLEYAEYVKRLVAQTSNQADGMLTDYSGKKVRFSSLLKASNGKIIYVDFWASWCSPCKAELPLSLALHKANPNVAFLYLSIDSNINAWKKAVVEQALDPKSCYLIDKEKESTIAKQYKIKTVPHYLIFDKKGNLFDRDAPRPSESNKLTQIFKAIQ